MSTTIPPSAAMSLSTAMPPSTAIVGGRYLAPTGQLLDRGSAAGAGLTILGEHIGSVAALEDRIAGTGAADSGPSETEGRGAVGDRVIDATNLIVSPGFVDLQINGGFGIDLLSDPEGMWELGRRLTRHGVTGFLPTIISSPPACTTAAMEAFRNRPVDHVGAEPLGLHFEGPMLSPGRPGAHPVQHLQPADTAVIADWSRRNGVVLVTIAPELANAAEVIAELVERGVTVSAGHSEATAEQAAAGIEAGVTMVTHLFNAMAPLEHRNPNLVGLALARPELVTGVIIDGVHLAPETVALVWNAKGADGLAVVTDAVAPMGMGPGAYRFGGLATHADDTEVRTADGVLAGSILTMDQAVRNLVAYSGCQPGDALSAASATPARVIGDTTRGRLDRGALADVVLLDQRLEVQITISRGRVVHVADEARDRLSAELLEDV